MGAHFGSVRAVLARSLVVGGALTTAVLGEPLAASASTVIKVIPIAVGFSPVAVSSDGTHVWVANSGGAGTVTEIRASDATVINPAISVGSGPDGISSDGTHVWVANSAGTVTELDASTGAVIQTISVGSDPGGISSGRHSRLGGRQLEHK